jgi:hypothetical protein
LSACPTFTFGKCLQFFVCSYKKEQYVLLFAEMADKIYIYIYIYWNYEEVEYLLNMMGHVALKGYALSSFSGMCRKKKNDKIHDSEFNTHVQ